MKKTCFIVSISLVLSISFLKPSYFNVQAEEIPKIKYLTRIDGRTTGSLFGQITKIFIDDNKEEMWIVDSGNSRMVITDLFGTILHVFKFSDAKIVGDIVSIAVDNKGDLYAASSDKIFMISYSGVFKKEIDATIFLESGLSIQSITIGEDYRFYVGATEQNKKAKVYVLDKDFKKILTIEGKFQNAIGLAVDEDKICFIDGKNYKVLQFDHQGNLITTFGAVSSLEGGFSMPTDMVLYNKGRIAVVDANRVMVIFFNKDGKFLTSFGTPKIFSWPRALGISLKRNIMAVADKSNRIMLFEILEETISDETKNEGSQQTAIEPPKTEDPHAEPPKIEPPKTEDPNADTPKTEPPKE